jgi:hypothetical protein
MQSSSTSFTISFSSFIAIPLLFLSNYYNQYLFLCLLLISLFALALGSIGKYRKFKALNKWRESYYEGEASFLTFKRGQDKNWDKFSRKTLFR